MAQQFGSFTASELYCPKCRRSQPVRERLLLVLPMGELHDLVCSRCATSLGKRTVSAPAVAPVPLVPARPDPLPGGDCCINRSRRPGRRNGFSEPVLEEKSSARPGGGTGQPGVYSDSCP